MRRYDPVSRLVLFDDSKELARALIHESGDYWRREASDHIRGLWIVASALKNEVVRLRKLEKQVQKRGNA